MGDAVSSDDIHEAIADQLRRSRQRYTEGRRELVQLLLDAEGPVAISELVDRSGELAQSSVYRNLQVLEQTGSVRRIATTGTNGARFELAEDLTSHHHHLICRVCGSVWDFELSDELEDSLGALSGHAPPDNGFTVEQHRLDLVGTCKACAR